MKNSFIKKERVRFFITLSLVFFSGIAFAQREKMMKSPSGEMELMKKYFLCILSRAENKGELDQAATTKILDGHRTLMAEYLANGTVILSGPLESKDALGAYLYDVETLEKAEELIKADPAVVNQRFSYKILPWWVKKETTLK